MTLRHPYFKIIHQGWGPKARHLQPALAMMLGLLHKFNLHQALPSCVSLHPTFPSILVASTTWHSHPRGKRLEAKEQFSSLILQRKTGGPKRKCLWFSRSWANPLDTLIPVHPPEVEKSYFLVIVETEIGALALPTSPPQSYHFESGSQARGLSSSF